MSVCSADLERGVIGVLEYLLVASNMASIKAVGPLSDAHEYETHSSRTGAPPKSDMRNSYQGLALLKHRTLAAAVWDLQAGDYPMISKAMAVKWILEYSSAPTVVCHEDIDISHPALPLEGGEVVLLLAQASTNENGTYVYASGGLPLMR